MSELRIADDKTRPQCIRNLHTLGKGGEVAVQEYFSEGVDGWGKPDKNLVARIRERKFYFGKPPENKAETILDVMNIGKEDLKINTGYRGLKFRVDYITKFPTLVYAWASSPSTFEKSFHLLKSGEVWSYPVTFNISSDVIIHEDDSRHAFNPWIALRGKAEGMRERDSFWHEVALPESGEISFKLIIYSGYFRSPEFHLETERIDFHLLEYLLRSHGAKTGEKLRKETGG